MGKPIVFWGVEATPNLEKAVQLALKRSFYRTRSELIRIAVIKELQRLNTTVENTQPVFSEGQEEMKEVECKSCLTKDTKSE